MNTEMRKIYLVRHAESVWNRERRVQGTRLDVPLSTVGRAQARLLGERLRDMPVRAVFCSVAGRAVETAQIALGEDYPMTTLEELQELSLGNWEGRLISELREENLESVERWYHSPTSVKIEGGEDLHAFRKRSVGAMTRIVETTGGDVLVVTHGGVICSYLTHIFNMNLDDLWSFSLPNASITTLVSDFRMRLRSFGDTAHLRGDTLGFDGMPSAM